MHIIVNAIDFDGKKVSDKHERYRSEKLSRKLEREHGLTVVKPR